MSMSELLSVVRQGLTPASFYLFWWVAVRPPPPPGDGYRVTNFPLWDLREQTMALQELSSERNEKNEIVKCKITGNSSYNTASSAIIARQTLLRVYSIADWSQCELRNGYIQRFSYNCTQYSRSNLRRTGVLESLTSPRISLNSEGSVTSSSTSLGSDVMK